MVCMFASSAVDRVCELQYGQTKEYKIGISWISAKHAALKSKSKLWLDSESE
jgi:hypothetical protein